MNAATVVQVQRFSVHDGPGVRTTVFLKGCPLRCLWCHNPETMDARPEVMIKDDHCLGCDACVPVCGPGLAGRLDRDPAANRPDETCERCGACADACPAGARERSGTAVTLEEILAEASRDRTYYEASGGGVTISGGEPLSGANAPFTMAALRECRERGLHVAVDTCGHVETSGLLAAAEIADLVLYDLKHMDGTRHRALTGVDNGRILANLRAVCAADTDVVVRFPLIPGLNDERDNLVRTARFVADLDGAPSLHLLPYHALAGDKYRRLGRTVPLTGIQPHDEATVEAVARTLRSFGPEVIIGGRE